MYSWFQNLINLKNIFDKYLPMVREVYNWFISHKDELEDLHKQINELRRTIELLKPGGPTLIMDPSVERPDCLEAEEPADAVPVKLVKQVLEACDKAEEDDIVIDEASVENVEVDESKEE